MLRVDEAAVPNQTDQAARGIGAAAEAQNVDLIALLVRFGQKLIALDDVDLEAPPRRDRVDAADARRRLDAS